jgi:hypothetical protein
VLCLLRLPPLFFIYLLVQGVENLDDAVAAMEDIFRDPAHKLGKKHC